jgi:hypothetical protein
VSRGHPLQGRVGGRCTAGCQGSRPRVMAPPCFWLGESGGCRPEPPTLPLHLHFCIKPGTHHAPPHPHPCPHPQPSTYPLTPQACDPRNTTSIAWRGGRGWWTPRSRPRAQVGHHPAALVHPLSADERRPGSMALSLRVSRVPAAAMCPLTKQGLPGAAGCRRWFCPASPLERRLPAALPGEEPGEPQGALRLHRARRLRQVHPPGA